MSLQDVVMSSGKGGTPAPNQTQPQTAPADGPEPGSDLGGKQGSGTGAEGKKLAAWTDQLSKEYRENPEYAGKLAGLEKLDDLAKGYFELQGKTDIPGQDAKPEDVEAFWKKLGYPEKPEGYAVAKDQNAGTFLSAAHAARLTDEQATALWKSVSEGTARQLAAVQQVQQAELQATDAALQKEFGDKYDYAVEMFERGIGNKELKARLINAGLAGKPEIVKAFIALGESMQESGSPKSGDAPGGGKDHMNGPWYK
jgi:hypothetical protein